MKAASAEVVEALTVGVAEAAGAEAGEEAGAKVAGEEAAKAVQVRVVGHSAPSVSLYGAQACLGITSHT